MKLQFCFKAQQSSSIGHPSQPKTSRMCVAEVPPVLDLWPGCVLILFADLF